MTAHLVLRKLSLPTVLKLAQKTVAWTKELVLAGSCSSQSAMGDSLQTRQTPHRSVMPSQRAIKATAHYP